MYPEGGAGCIETREEEDVTAKHINMGERAKWQYMAPQLLATRGYFDVLENIKRTVTHFLDLTPETE